MIFPIKLILLKAEKANIQGIIDFLKFYLGNSLKVSESDGIKYITTDNFSEHALEEALNSFSTDSLINFSLFESNPIRTKEEYNRALKFSYLFKNDILKNTYYNEKSLINYSSIYNIDNKLTRKLAFRKYFDDSDMINICRAMFKSNLNISKAAEYLYIHRNTLKYKLDNFLNVTNFDLRVFFDASLLEQILKK